MLICNICESVSACVCVCDCVWGNCHSLRRGNSIMGTIWVVHWSHHSLPSDWSSPYHHPIPYLLSRFFSYLPHPQQLYDWGQSGWSNGPLVPPFPPLWPLFRWSPPHHHTIPSYHPEPSLIPIISINSIISVVHTVVPYPGLHHFLPSYLSKSSVRTKKRLNKAGRRDYQT